jgi:TIR domain
MPRRTPKPALTDHVVFLCYRHRDQTFVRSLHKRLKVAGIPTWFDGERLVAGDRLHSVIGQALRNSRIVVICFGPDGLGRFQQTEVDEALELELDDVLKVIPIVLPDVAPEAEIPPFLRAFHYVDFRRSDFKPFPKLLGDIRHVLESGRTGDLDGVATRVAQAVGPARRLRSTKPTRPRGRS